MPARTDQTTDPEVQRALLLMRRGQAFWARKLNELGDDAFDAPSKVPGWTRRHLIAHVGFNGRALARLVEGAAAGVEARMYETESQCREEVAFGATLPVDALRNLCAHAAVHLNVSWRDLPEPAWSNRGRDASGRLVPASATVRMRTREVWMHAIDLGNGATMADLPPELATELTSEPTPGSLAENHDCAKGC